MFYTYVLYSFAYKQIHIGHTNNLEVRVSEHNQGLSKSTKRYIPWEIIYYEEYSSRAEAMRKEKQLKSHKGRDFIKRELLNGGVRQPPD